MNVDQYFQNSLEALKDEVELTEDEQKMLKLGQLTEFIFKKITSKKFRRNKLTPETLDTIKSKIIDSVDNNKPIYLIFGFGGFKNSNISEHHPHIGWGEVFNLLYISRILRPILQVYQPGVKFEYESENVGVAYANNYTKQDLETYDKDFRSLIEFFSHFIPQNLEFSYMKVEEFGDPTETLAKSEKTKQVELEKLLKLPEQELSTLLERAKHNMKLNGVRDLTNLHEEALREEALMALSRCYAFLEEDYVVRQDYFNGEERIMTIGSYCTPSENPDNWITINSTAHSANAFWTSHGVLEYCDNKFAPVLVGPKRYTEIKNNLDTVKTSTFTEIAPGLDKIQIHRC